MSKIEFDKATHRYFDNGRRIISVTQYLKLAGCVDYEWCSLEGRLRGEATHAAIHYLNQNDLDRASLHSTIQPRVAAWDKFVVDTGFKPRLVEHIVYDPIYGVAGTLDVTGTWKLSNGLILPDIKTGPIEDHVALQTAAYEAALGEPHRRFGLQLKPDGTYRLSDEFKDRNDIKVFRSMIVTVNWNIQHGMIDLERDLAA